MRVRYASGVRRFSSWLASVLSIRQIHPAPYGSLFNSSGVAERLSFTSVTLPSMGEMMSETDLVDSTSAKAAPALVALPDSGSST